MITRNHRDATELSAQAGDPFLTSAGPKRPFCDQTLRQVIDVTIHNIMHRLWMKLNRPLTVA